MSDRDRPRVTVELLDIFENLHRLLNNDLEEHQLYLISKEIKHIQTRITNISSVKQNNL